MLEILAKHLRTPDGFIGKLIAILMNTINDDINRFTINQLQLQPNDKVMEIGFGNGKYFTDVLKQASNGKLIGLDYSETMVNQAKKRFHSFIKQEKLEVTQGSVSRIPYEDNTFDKIYTVNTIYFWQDSENDIKEIFRVLKENGQLVISFRSREGMEKLSFTKHGFTLYSTDEVMTLVKSAGFKYVSLVTASGKVTEVYCVVAIK